MIPPKKQNALILHSQERVRASLAERLEGMGYECLQADTVDRAAQRIADEGVRLALIEVFGFGPDSRALVRETAGEYPMLSIIAMIGPGNATGTMTEAVRLGVDQCLLIPRDIDRIDEVVALAAEHRQLVTERMARIESLEHDFEHARNEVLRAATTIEQHFLDTVKAFIGLLEIRDHHMGSHAKRVATFSRSLSEQYDLNDRVRHDIELGGLLHDIGKISIPDKILLKTRNFFASADLTNKERDLYRQHPVIGQESVEMVSMLSTVGTYIRHHHEAFDGSGFPDSLDGFYIPLGARIVGIADTYDKIVHSMPKAKQAEAEILFMKYVEKYKKKLFDPEVASKMVTLMKQLKRQQYAGERRITIANLEPGMVLARDVYTMSGVLVISQYEHVTGNDIARLNRFSASGMVMDSVYVFSETPSGKSPQRNVFPETVAAGQDATAVIQAKLHETIDATTEYATLSAVHLRTGEHLQNPQFTREDITRMIQHCPVISLRILRVANSMLFDHERSIRTIPQAVRLLGMNEVRRIARSTPVIDDEGVHGPFTRSGLWMHLTGCGIISDIVARHLGFRRTTEYFTAGMLHDLGKVVFDQLYPQQFRRVLTLATEQSMFYRKAERTVFGEAHSATGAYLLEHWNIPEVIVDAVQNHHSPQDSEKDAVLTSVVHLADIIAHMLHIGESGERSVPRLEPFAEQKLGMSLADLESLVPQIDDELAGARNILFGGFGEESPE